MKKKKIDFNGKKVSVTDSWIVLTLQPENSNSVPFFICWTVIITCEMNSHFIFFHEMCSNWYQNDVDRPENVFILFVIEK